MKSLYLRIYLTVVAALLLFALGSAWLFHQEVQRERGRFEERASERVGAWAELIQRSLPPADAPRDEQASALREWAQRLRSSSRLSWVRPPASRAKAASTDSTVR